MPKDVSPRRDNRKRRRGRCEEERARAESERHAALLSLRRPDIGERFTAGRSSGGRRVTGQRSSIQKKRQQVLAGSAASSGSSHSMRLRQRRFAKYRMACLFVCHALR